MTDTSRTRLFADLEPLSVHCATLCELDDGRLLAAAYAFPFETSAETKIVASYFDGSGWSPSRTLIDLPGIAVGNPVLWSPEPGRIELFFVTLVSESWTEAIVCVQGSRDAGRTWSAAKVVHGRRGLMTKTRPVRSGDLLLLPVYDERNWCSHVLARRDDVDEWRLFGDTTSRGKTIQPAIAGLADGRLLMLSRSPHGTIFESYSFNQGLAWTASQPTPLPNPNSGIDLLKLEDGRLLLAYNPQTRGRERLGLSVADKEGRGWSDPMLLEHGTGEYSYPFMIQSRNGTIHMLYTEQRTHIVHVQLQPQHLPVAVDTEPKDGGAHDA